MENSAIPEEKIKVSSVKKNSKLSFIRPNIHGNYWCAKVMNLKEIFFYEEVIPLLTH